MRTRRLRRWVAGLCAAAALIVAGIWLASPASADVTWSNMIQQVDEPSGR
jgi:hypothetical protein